MKTIMWLILNFLFDTNNDKWLIIKISNGTSINSALRERKPNHDACEF